MLTKQENVHVKLDILSEMFCKKKSTEQFGFLTKDLI